MRDARFKGLETEVFSLSATSYASAVQASPLPQLDRPPLGQEDKSVSKVLSILSLFAETSTKGVNWYKQWWWFLRLKDRIVGGQATTRKK